jgi:hypothetical protein
MIDSASPAAYGLRYVGIEPSPVLTVLGGDRWPAAHILQQQAEPAVRSPGHPEAGRDEDPPGALLVSVTEERAVAITTTGEVTVDRNERSVTIAGSVPRDSASLAHPGLAFGSVMLAYWRGDEGFHASGIVVDGRAWALSGPRGAGKSTLVAWLALHGTEILCDDLLIVSGERAFAGPRCVDLRPDAAERLGIVDSTELVRDRSRHRLHLPPIQADVPFGGFVYLSDQATAEPSRLDAGEALRRVVLNRSLFGLPPRAPGGLVAYGALPAFELRRADGWDRFERTGRLLVELLRDTT